VPNEQSRHPYAVAMAWVSRITTVALEMVLPGLVGIWLDRRWGTSPWITLLGFGLGMTLAIWHLIQMTRGSNSKGGSQRPPPKDPSS
jgi:cyanate permease